MDEARAAAAFMRKTGKIPKSLRDKPVLFPGLALYMRAFEQLTSCRTSGMTPGPIPWTAIRDWAEEYDIKGSQRRALFRYTRALDMVYLEHCAQQQPGGK